MASPEIADGPDGPLAGHPQALRPLTHQLIAAVLANRGYAIAVDDDGDLVGRWEDSLIWFYRRGAAGELLQVRVVTGPRFGIEQVPALYAFCNAWNHDRLLPKAYVHEPGDGTLVLAGDVTTDLALGVAPAQLVVLLTATVSTGVAYAEAVAALP
ncbi:YbjN domain-containing protein [Micromonospora sp. R77]|uniref:YbjN domain-containing protein n=1 Tax=Micromonospora sp. R77 TaxID=2925836 RepID=UPI001F61531D|nr:YbjN domain-containing protein [Micromonospora sp. R77]MCI4064853.1 YbjN domain-containing protein [Micromonospora sp. R77]